MQTRLKAIAILGVVLAAAVARAEDAVLGFISIDRGFTTRVELETIRHPDGRSFRIFGGSAGFAWSALAGTRIPPGEVRQLRIIMRLRMGSGAMFLSLQNARTGQWERIRAITLPTASLQYYITPLTANPGRFVGSGGKIRFRAESVGPATAFFDYLSIGVDR